MDERITREEVRHVARLGRLELNEQEEKHFTEQMNQILSYMEKLNELDTTDILPMSHAVPLQNVFRPDEVKPSLSREKALENAPQSDQVSFVVPKVI
jgi:aspartyl-tRNA(Asn)/glutamyl-tRNA(Gln) amidotransferase subunit C